jgi:hypothetical protein
MSLTPSQRLHHLQIAAWLAIVVHLVAGATMALILRHGLAANADLNSRLAFLANDRALWICGWIPWNIAALCILYFFYAFHAAHKEEASPMVLPALAVSVCFIAVLFDLFSQYIAMAMLPDLAAKAVADPQQLPKFHELYKMLVIGSGGIGNGAYTLATVLAAWSVRRIYPRSVTLSAVAVGVIGLGVSIASLLDSIALQVAFNAALIPVLTAWLFGVAIAAQRRVKNCADSNSGS